MQITRKWLVGMVTALAALFGMLLIATRPVSAAATNNSRPLIIYFSMTGTTKGAAQAIQRDTGGKLVRVYRKKPYPNGYDSMAKTADRERRRGIHPAIKGNVPNLKNYQTIYIGYPTWWSQPPMVIHSLFDKYDFRGKTIVPFTTSMSTPMRDSMGTMRQLGANDGATVKNGFRYDDNPTALCHFLQRNGLLNNN